MIIIQFELKTDKKQNRTEQNRTKFFELIKPNLSLKTDSEKFLKAKANKKDEKFKPNDNNKNNSKCVFCGKSTKPMFNMFTEIFDELYGVKHEIQLYQTTLSFLSEKTQQKLNSVCQELENLFEKIKPTLKDEVIFWDKLVQNKIGKKFLDFAEHPLTTCRICLEEIKQQPERKKTNSLFEDYAYQTEQKFPELWEICASEMGNERLEQFLIEEKANKLLEKKIKDEAFAELKTWLETSQSSDKNNTSKTLTNTDKPVNKTPLIIGGIVAGAVIIGLIAWYSLKTKKKKAGE